VVTQEEIGKKYGIDTARLYLLFMASPEKELDWNDEGVQGAYRFLNRIYRLVNGNVSKISFGKYSAKGVRDKILDAKTSIAIEKVSRQIDSFQFNLAVNSIMELANYMQEYAESGGMNKPLFGDSVKILIQLLSPFGPHIAEELWEKSGMKGFVSSSEWPKKRKADKKATGIEHLVNQLKTDITEVMKLARMKPDRIELIVAPEWKYDLVKQVKAELKKTRDPGVIMKAVMGKKKFRPFGKGVAKIVTSLIKNPERIPRVVLDMKEEASAIKEMVVIMKEDFGCKVVMKFAEKSSSKKASNAMPGKPGIEIS
jgi:leucyl-tRNA synthetase